MPSSTTRSRHVSKQGRCFGQTFAGRANAKLETRWKLGSVELELLQVEGSVLKRASFAVQTSRHRGEGG